MKFNCPHCNVTADDKELALYEDDDYYEDEEEEEEEEEYSRTYLGISSFRIVKCSSCDKIFFSIRSLNEYSLYYSREYPDVCHKREFSKIINDLSSNFVECYNQSLFAIKNELTELAGSGLRKSVEYLIKSFVTNEVPEKATEIKQDTSLSNIINNRLPNNSIYDGIKDIANRAWWIGSDYTHTHKKYEEYNEDDLLSLVDILVTEIERFYQKQSFITTITKR